VLLLPVTLPAQDKPDSKTADSAASQKNDDDEKSEEEKTKIKTVDVETKPFIVYESFNGVLESTRTHEVKTNFDIWTDLKIESVVDDGDVVAAGQELLKLVFLKFKELFCLVFLKRFELGVNIHCLI
jgi:hypothetical protein